MAEPNYGLLDTAMPYKVGGSVLKGMIDVNALRSQNLQNEATQFETQNALAEQEAYKKAAQTGNVQQALMESGLGKQALTAGKTMAETAETKRKEMKLNLDIMRERTKDLLGNLSNENYAAHLQEGVRDNLITPEQAQRSYQIYSSIPMNQRGAYVKQQLTKAEDMAQLEEQRRHNKVQEGISGGHLALAQKEFNLKQQEKTPEGQQLKDVQSNVKALRTAGYDPETGEDKVSKLIGQSTSGWTQTLAAKSYGATRGGSTSGMKAIGKLNSISKTMTLDLLNNKLGAGISNADRDALEARFGSIADPTIPAEQRLAAWSEAKDIMRRAAMLPEVKTGKSTDNNTVDKSNPLLK